MSRIDKKEIDEELSHQRDILKRLRENYRTLEKQEVSFGLSVPPHIVSEMNRLAERIQQITERIEHLEVQSVEEGYSLAEAEYRVIVARAWKDGSLDALGGAELQLSRLKLKIPIERAEKIEQEIKDELLNQSFKEISLDVLWKSLVKDNKEMFKLFYKLIRLNYNLFSEMICKSLEITEKAPNQLFREYSDKENKVSEHHLIQLEKNIIIANNLVDHKELLFLHEAIEHLKNMLNSYSLLARK